MPKQKSKRDRKAKPKTSAWQRRQKLKSKRAKEQGTREGRRRKNVIRQNKELSRRTQNEGYLPGIGGGIISSNSVPTLLGGRFDVARQPWASPERGAGGARSQTWQEDRGVIHPTHMPSSFPVVEGGNTRPSGSQMFDRNMERLGKHYRSGPDLSTELYLLEKNKGRRPLLVPTKASLSRRYE